MPLLTSRMLQFTLAGTHIEAEKCQRGAGGWVWVEVAAQASCHLLHKDTQESNRLLLPKDTSFKINHSKASKKKKSAFLHPGC